MRNLLRSYAVSVAYLHVVFMRGTIHLQYELSERQAADIYTNTSLDGEARDHVARLIGMGDPSIMTAATEIRFGEIPPPTKAALREAAKGAEAAVVKEVQRDSGQTGTSGVLSFEAARSTGKTSVVAPPPGRFRFRS